MALEKVPTSVMALKLNTSAKKDISSLALHYENVRKTENGREFNRSVTVIAFIFIIT